MHECSAVERDRTLETDVEAETITRYQPSAGLMPIEARGTASHSSRHDMLAIISSRYQYGPFLFFFVAEVMSNYLTTDGLKKISLLPEAALRPVAFATPATWLIRHCTSLATGLHHRWVHVLQT